MKYKSVQAGPKIQFGGAKNGLLRFAYQFGIAAMVNGVPRMPTNSHPTTYSISFANSFIVRVCTLGWVIINIGNKTLKLVLKSLSYF